MGQHRRALRPYRDIGHEPQKDQHERGNHEEEKKDHVVPRSVWSAVASVCPVCTYAPTRGMAMCVVATSPSRAYSPARVTRTDASSPMSPGSPGKLMILLVRVRPVSLVGSFLLGPSTRTSQVCPSYVRLAARAMRFCMLSKPSKRRCLTSCGTWSGRPGATVPGRSE